MIQPTPQVEQFKRYLRDSLRRETLNARTIKIAKYAQVYANGDQIALPADLSRVQQADHPRR